MNLLHYFWYFDSILPKKTCNKIIKFALSQKKEKASIFTPNTKVLFSKNKTTLSSEEELYKKRKSNVAWIDEAWIYNLINPYIHTANRNSGWKFDLSWVEPYQFAYYKKGQFFGWHKDGVPLPADNTEHTQSLGNIRKISCSIQLSDPSKYKGGELEFDPRQHDPDKIGSSFYLAPNKQGTIICFPSFLWHRVKPITKGKRYSMSCWYWGKPFR